MKELRLMRSWRTEREKEIDYDELVHTIMESKKSHDLPTARRRRPGKSDYVNPSPRVED